MDIVAIGQAKAAVFKTLGRKTRRFAYGVSNCNAAGSAAGSQNDILQRIPIKLPVTTTRWRMHFRNAYALSSGWAANTGALSFTGVWIGKHATSTSAPQTGQFTAAPTAAIPAFTTDAAGAEYVSPWVTDSAAQIVANTDHLLSMGFTCASTTSIATQLATTPWLWRTANASQSAGAQSAAGINQTVSPYATFGDIWIEYEYVGAQGGVLQIGDSRSAGYAPTAPGVLAGANWPHQWQMITGVPVLCAAISGASTTQFIGSSPALTKFGIGTNIFPEAASIDLGINDFGASQQANSVRGNIQTLIGLLNGWGINRIFLSTIPGCVGYTGYPSTVQAGVLTAAAASGASSVTTSVPFASGASIVIGSVAGGDAEARTVQSASTGSAGSYTTPLTSPTGVAHLLNAPIVTQPEYQRRDFNNWARAQPLGFVEVIENDRLQRDSTTSWILDSEVDAGDKLHINTIGQRRWAHAMPHRPIARL